MADIKELSKKLKLKSVMGILERQVINFLNEYHVAVEYSVKSVLTKKGINENSEGGKGGKNRKTKKNKRGKGRNK